MHELTHFKIEPKQIELTKSFTWIGAGLLGAGLGSAGLGSGLLGSAIGSGLGAAGAATGSSGLFGGALATLANPVQGLINGAQSVLRTAGLCCVNVPFED